MKSVFLLRLNESLNEQNKNIPFAFGIDENGNYGYIKDGADTVTPFKSEISIEFLMFSRHHQSKVIAGLSGYKTFSYDSLTLQYAITPYIELYKNDGTLLESFTATTGATSFDISNADYIDIIAKDNNSVDQISIFNNVVIS